MIKRLMGEAFSRAIFFLLITLFLCPLEIAAQQKKKRNEFWEIGAYAAHSFITGDIPPAFGYGGGVSFRRTFGKIFSARADYTRSINYGLDHRRRKVSRLAWDTPFDPWVNYYESGNRYFVANYRTALHQLSAQAIASINIKKVSSGAGTVSLYGYAGYSMLLADIGVDALDDNNLPYNFNDPASPVDFKRSRSEIVKSLRTFMNRNYESKWGETNNQSINHYTGTNQHPVRHAASIGTGIYYGLSTNSGLQLDYRLSTAFTDYLDGVTTGAKFDIHHLAAIGFTYRFGGTKAIKKNTDVPGIATINTPSYNLKTTIHVVDPIVSGKTHIVDGDTTYLLSFEFLPLVPGIVTPLHRAHVRLLDGKWMELPVHGSRQKMLTTKYFTYTVSLTREQLMRLATNKASHLHLETSSMALEDIIHPDKQKLLIKVSKMLLE